MVSPSTQPEDPPTSLYLQICVLILMQLNMCVVCGSVLHRGHSGDGYLSASILFKYDCMRWHLFVLSLERV